MLVTVTNLRVSEIPCDALVTPYPATRPMLRVLIACGFECTQITVPNNQRCIKKLAIPTLGLKNVVLLCNYNRCYPLHDTFQEAFNYAQQNKLASLAFVLDEYESIFGQHERIVAQVLRMAVIQYESSFSFLKPRVKSIYVVTSEHKQITEIFSGQ